ncbi:unnamed protein product, partial [Staurois parvus]
LVIFTVEPKGGKGHYDKKKGCLILFSLILPLFPFSTVPNPSVAVRAIVASLHMLCLMCIAREVFLGGFM